MNQKLFDECFDNSKDEYYQILKIIEENKNYSKIQCEGRELHHIIPCNYWMSTLKISRYKAQKIDECKNEDNLISLSYIDHVKIHYFYYKCCKEIINKACIHSFDFMLKTRDIHLKDITESWINEHKQEIEELKEKMSELHSEVAKESNKGRFKYETQEDALNAWKNGELSRSRYTEYCRSRGWKIEKLLKKKYQFDTYEELEKLYNDDVITLEEFKSYKYSYFPNSNKQKRYKLDSYETVVKLYDDKKITRSYFTVICKKKGWKCELFTNKYNNYEELKIKYLNNEITYNAYEQACKSHGWKNEFKKEFKYYSSFDELEKDLKENLITRSYFRSICNKNNWKFEYDSKYKRYDNYEDALNALNKHEITRQNFTVLCNNRGWKYEKIIHRNNTLFEALERISEGKYMPLSNYRRMCKNHKWNYDISEYDNAIIKGLKLGNLTKENVKEWKSLYNEYV